MSARADNSHLFITAGSPCSPEPRQRQIATTAAVPIAPKGVAPLGAATLTFMFRLPLLQIAMLGALHRLRSVREAVSFPARISDPVW